MKLQGTVRFERLGENQQRFDPLRENDGFATILGHLFHVGEELLHLGTRPGEGIEIANLL